MRRIEISLNSVFQHDIEMSVGLPIDRSKFRPDAVSMVHKDGKGGENVISIQTTLVDDTKGTITIKRIGQYPAGGVYEVQIDNDILLPEHRAIFGGILFMAPGPSKT